MWPQSPLGWLVVGVLLHVLQQVVRTRGWFTIIRAAYPEATELRGRDGTFAYLAGSGLNSVVPARGGDLAKLYLIRRRAPGTRWSTLAATFVPEALFETAVGIGLVIWALSRAFWPCRSRRARCHRGHPPRSRSRNVERSATVTVVCRRGRLAGQPRRRARQRSGMKLPAITCDPAGAPLQRSSRPSVK